MPTVPGANLNTSNIAGSTNCDLLVPVTYIDAGCMNSLPLLFTFYEPHHVQNQPPEAEDQDISVNANSPIKIKLEAKDPDDDKLKFVIDTKPYHGRIAQFSSLAGTLAYIPDANYDWNCIQSS